MRVLFLRGYALPAHSAGKGVLRMIDRVNALLRKAPPLVVYVLGALPVVWLFWQGIQGGLGVDPVKAIEHRLGLWGLWWLIAALAVTPLARFTGIKLIRYRRAIGLMGFFYILVHLAVWLVLDVQIPSQIWGDILKRPYITLGMAAFVLLIPLAVTSNNWSVRKLGAARWKRLQRLAYLAVPLGAVHFTMVVKGWQLEPFYYLGVILFLLALRFVPNSWRVAPSRRAPAR